VPVIDVHTHVFNMHDLPLGGILFSRISDKTAEAVTAAVIRSMAEEGVETGKAGGDAVARPPRGPAAAAMPTDSVTTDADAMSAEPTEPDTVTTAPSDEAEVEAADAPPEPQVKLTPEERALFAEFLDQSQDPPLATFSREAAAETDSPHATPSPQELPSDFDRLTDVLYHGGFLTEADDAVESGPFLAPKPTPLGYRRFIRLMFLPPAAIVRTLSREYPKADLFVAHMMDMDRAYAGRSRRPFEQQQQDMPVVTRQFRGQLVHFTAFDPFRDNEAIKTIEAGLNAGAIGVKFYPPSGYRAASNVIPSPPPRPPGAVRRWKSRYGNRSAKALDATMRSFFAKMAADQIPIFTHCTREGFEAVSDYGLNSSPEYWAIVLEEFPDLRLCFGHAGGQEFWFSRPGAEHNEQPPEGKPESQEAWRFGRQVVDLCLKYKNVYCEVGYLTAVLTDDGRDRLTKRLERELPRPSTAVGAGPSWQFGDKLMYGTDWHMFYKEKRRKKYLSAFDQVVSNIDGGGWQRKFFSGNAVAYLKLSELAGDRKKPFTDEQRAKWAEIARNATEKPRLQ
jgi:predicted TIM-barrel fold metal-dependent hydrolase